jgi:hypothetical protein
LRRHIDDLDPAVLARERVGGILQPFLAEAGDEDLLLGNAEIGNQEAANRFGAPVRERKIIFRAAGGIGSA